MSHEPHEFRCHEGLVSPTSLLELILQLFGYAKVHKEEVIFVIHMHFGWFILFIIGDHLLVIYLVE